MSVTLDGVTYTGEVSGGVWQLFVPQAAADSLTLGSNNYTATVSNLGGANASISGSFTYNDGEPLTISLADSELAAGESTTVTFTFSSAVSGFDDSDVTVSNGTLSSLSTSDNITWTATFTPSADTTDQSNVIVVGSQWTFDNGDATPDTSRNVSFASVPGIVTEANNLTKDTDQPDAWDTGTFSTEVISGNGSVSTVAAETDTLRMIGLSTTDENAGYITIDFALFLSGGASIAVWESGTQVVANAGQYSSGDVITIERTGGQITYLKNGNVFYTSDKISSGELHVDTALYSNGATLNDITIGDGNTAASANYEVLTGTPTLTIDALTGDNAIDGVEAGRDLLVTGTATAIADGETISVSLDGTTYSALVSDGAWAVVIPAGALASGTVAASYTNSAGVVADADQPITVDNAPLTISLDDSELAAGETATVTFTFTEAVSGFGLEDISAGSGTLSNLQSSDGGITWTATLTPEAGVRADVNTISVNDGWTYDSGNPVPATGAEYDVSFTGSFNSETTRVTGNSVVKIGEANFVIWEDNAIGASLPYLRTDPDQNSSAFSNQSISGNGYLATTLGDDDGTKAIGLSYDNHGGQFRSIDFAVVFEAGGGLSFYQGGTDQLSAEVSAAEGDQLRLAVNDGVVSVQLNGVTVHTFTEQANSARLFADIALNSPGAAFYDIVMSDSAVATSADYAVNTELLIDDISVAGNVLTVDYNLDLSASFVPDASSFNIVVESAGRAVTGVAINGSSQLEVTFGGSALADDEQLAFSYTATGTNKLQDAEGGLAGNINNAIVGNDNLHTLEGSALSDTIVGTATADVIIGNEGDDMLLGLSGADTFDFNYLPDGNGTDTILDFQTGAGGDVIDLADVLLGFEAGVSDMSDFVRAEAYSDSDDRLVLQIDLDGVGNVNSDPFTPGMTIVLDNILVTDVNVSTFVDDLNTNGNIVL